MSRAQSPNWETNPRISYRRRAQLKLYGMNLLTFFTVIVIAFPILWTIATAVRPTTAFFQRPTPLIPTEVTLDHFKYIFTESNVPDYYVNTIVVAIGVVLLNTTIATLGGYGLTRIDIPHKASFARMVLFGYMFPSILLAIPMFIFWEEIGIINSYPGLILAEVAKALPFSLWMMWKYFQTVPVSLEESAQMAGATRFRAFYEIALPMAKPGIIAIAVYTYATSWDAYTIPKIIVPAENRWVLTIGVETLVQGFSVNWGAVMAAIVLIMLPSFLLIFVMQKYLIRGFRAGGIG